MEIQAGSALHQLMHRCPAPGRSQIDLSSLIGDGLRTADLLANRTDHLLSEFHHPEVIGVGLVDLN